MIRLAVLAPALLGIAGTAAAQNPFVGFDHFPQFRQLSGLSGGGFGLDPDGWGSLSGATAYSSPIGYALGHDQVRIQGGETFFSWHHFTHKNSTGKANFMYGHTFGNINIAYSYFVKSFEGDASTNLQLSYFSKNRNEPGFSVGVQDIAGHGGSAGAGDPGDNRSSRSFFAAATMPIPVSTNGAPIYLTGGWGTRRFGKGFASASYQVYGPARLWTEFDGWGFNEGVLFTVRPSGTTEEGEGQRSFEADILLGVIRGKYPTVSVTLGF